MRARLLIPIAVCLLIGGCAATLTPLERQKVALYDAANTYQATTQSLVVMRQLGRIDDETWLLIKGIDMEAYTVLQAWNASVRNGVPDDASMQRLASMLDRLAILLAEAKAKEQSNVSEPGSGDSGWLDARAAA